MRRLAAIPLLFLASGSAFALTNGFAKPQIGYNPFYNIGTSNYAVVYTNVTRFFATNGVMDMVTNINAGTPFYSHIDGYWSDNTTNGSGVPNVDAAKFPQGLRAVSDYVHSFGAFSKIQGYAAGAVYTIGQSSPSECILNHQTNAAWFFAVTNQWDGLKYDFLSSDGTSKQNNAINLYNAFLTTGRATYLEMEDIGAQGFDLVSDWWMPTIANSARNQGDLSGTWAEVMRNLYSWQTNVPGVYSNEFQFNMDYLLWNVQSGPVLTSTLTDTEGRSQFALWAVSGASLFFGATNYTAAQVTALKTPGLYRIQQDDLILPGLITNDVAGKTVIRKPLAGGRMAFCVLNNTASAADITVPFPTWQTWGWIVPLDYGQSVKAAAGWATNSITLSGVPAHDTVVFELQTNAILYVDAGATGANNGTSWTDAWTSFTNLDRSQGLVHAGDTVYVKGGDYTTTHGQACQLQEGSSGNWTHYIFTNGVAKVYCVTHLRNYTAIEATNAAMPTIVSNNTYNTWMVTNNCNFWIYRWTNWNITPGQSSATGYGLWMHTYPVLVEGVRITGYTNRYDGDVTGKSDSGTAFFMDNDGTVDGVTNYIRFNWSDHSSGNGAGAVVAENQSAVNNGYTDISFNYFDNIGSDGISGTAHYSRIHHNWFGEREGHPDMGCNDTFFGNMALLCLDHNVIVPGDNDIFSFLYEITAVSSFKFYCNVLRPPAVPVQTSCGNAGFEQADPTGLNTTTVHWTGDIYMANNTLVGGSTHYPAAFINLKTRDNPGPYDFTIDDNSTHLVNNLVVRTATSATASVLTPFSLASFDSNLGTQVNSTGNGWNYHTNAIELDWNCFVDYFGGNLRIGTWGDKNMGVLSLTNAADVQRVIGYENNRSLTNASFLLDPATLDFHPTTTDVQMGTNLTALTSILPDINLDIYGNTRPATGPWSAGAVEFSPGSLVLHFDFARSDGWTTNGVLTDRSGSGNTGYKYASTGRETWPTWTNGPGNLDAARFTNNLIDGSGFHKGTYIVVPLTNSANQSLWAFTSGTWALWAEVDLDYALGYSGDEQFLTCGQDTNNWFFGNYYSTASTSGPQFSRASTTGGQEPMDTFSRWPNVTASDWHHYAITWDGSTMQAYYDGQLWNHGDGRTYTNANTFNYTTNFTGLLVSTNSVGLASSWIALGVNTHSGTPDPDDVDGLPNNGQLQGALADVRIYNRALSAAEIGAIYSATNGSNPTPANNQSTIHANRLNVGTVHFGP